MRKSPTPPRSARANAQIAAIEADVAAALKVVSDRIQPAADTPEEAAICTLENFVAIALRVFSKTNPSKLHSETRTVDLGIRLSGGVDCLGSVHQVKDTSRGAA